ncbi:HAMP domain-containing sensor histidine kinase [uncultured Parvimonas sp.]|uniref:sensor histidine kinase n=1 Tax=uncultured Parvimonas sp. TaxID=747372 RepID=UPI0028041EB4|nr:HAMP domain-containing sensor histidine kinase [uncultured Parvimonas sp.]
MKNLKIFPKMFFKTFRILGAVIVLIHLSVFFIFPRTYLETRKQELYAKADEISNNIKGKDLKFVERSLEFFSKSSDIKVVIKGENGEDEVQIGDNINVNLKSKDNSLIIEEREVELKNGKKIFVQFISTADMKKDAKELSFKFLPYSLAISFVFSIIVSLIYAKEITNNIKEIKNVTKKMMNLDRTAYLKIDSTNEVGELKEHINDLYSTLLKLIDDLELKNEEIVKLEKLKYDFFRGTSHELKTPLASLKIILENMKYNIGKYKNRDLYIENCIEIVDHLTRSISQMLSVSSFEHLKNDEEIIVVNDILDDVLKQYMLLANHRNIKVNNNLKNEKIYIGMTALKIVLSNLINNAVKYSDENGVINIGTKDDWLYIENSYKDNKDLDVNKIFEINFNLNKENSNGLGLYIVKNILLNYGIKYKVEKNEIGILFLIELSGNMDK